MILPIRLYSDPVISKVCEPVTDFTDPKLEELVQNMIETMMANHGIGLAASQVGVDKQIAILWGENKTRIITIINPVIKARTKEREKLVEGCLSAPGISIPMKRYKGVEIEAHNLLGEKVAYNFTDFDARILQHEWDHLNGKCIVHTLQNYTKVL